MAAGRGQGSPVQKARFFLLCFNRFEGAFVIFSRVRVIPFLLDMNPQSIVVMLSVFTLRKAFLFFLVFGFYNSQNGPPNSPMF